MRRPREQTFFTSDLSFYTPQLRHQHYAIVVAAVGQYELAALVRRYLRHPEFDTHAKRVGKIVRIASSGIGWWQLRRQQERSCLGTGKGQSIREVIQCVESVTGRTVSYREAPRRAGDPPALVADASRAAALLGCQPRYSDLSTIVETAWHWFERRS